MGAFRALSSTARVRSCVSRPSPIRLLALLALLSGLPQGWAGAQVREGFHFLNLTSGGRMSGLGGYHAAFLQAGLPESVSNPAFIAFQDSLSVHLSVSRHPGGLTSAHSAASGTLRSGHIGYLSVRSLGYGELEKRDERGTSLGEFRAMDAQLTAGTGVHLSTQWSAGGTVSLIHSGYGEYRSSAIAVSGGLLWMDRPGRTAAGLTIRNVGSALQGFTPSSAREDLPLRWALGLTHKPEYVGVRLHLTLEGDQHTPLRPDVLAGTEFLFSDSFRLRIGYHSGIHRTLKLDSRLDVSGLHFGFGLRTETFRLDLARMSWGQLGGITQLAVSIPLQGGLGTF